MSGSLLPNVDGQFFDNNGNPLVSGKIYTYAAGTSTPKASYADFALGSLNTNPVILDSAGRASIWGSGNYKIVIKSSADATIKSIDNVRLSGLTTTVVGDTSITGSVAITGGFDVDHTSVTTQYPVHIYHSNIWTNLDPYGSGTMKVEAKGQNNNQPVLSSYKHVNTANYGNSASLMIVNDGGTKVITDIFAADFEMVANNSLIDSVNGKFEQGVVSGYASGVGESGGGLYYIAPRQKTATGFERMTDFFQLSRGGRIYHRGEGISITPLYDPADTTNVSYSNNRAFVDITTAFTKAEINVTSTLSTGDASLELTSGSAANSHLYVTGGTGTATKIELQGGSGTYSRTRATTGTATCYVQQDDGAGGNAALELRSNWITPGTGSAIMNLYTDNAGGADGFRIQANGVNGRLNIREIANGTIKENIDIDPSADGLITIYDTTDYTKGSIRLGNGAGAAAGGKLTYDSGTGVLNLTGTNAKITANGSTLARLVNSAPANTAAAGEAGDYAITATFLYIYKAGTGWVRTAVATF